MNGYSCLVKGLLMYLMFSSSRCIVLSLNLSCLFMCIFSSSSEVYIRAPSKGRPFTIREVKASNIGQLVKISGIVTRCSDVKPLMQVAVYTCEECGFEIYQVINKQICLVWFINYVLCCVNDTLLLKCSFFTFTFLACWKWTSCLIWLTRNLLMVVFADLFYYLFHLIILCSWNSFAAFFSSVPLIHLSSCALNRK